MIKLLVDECLTPDLVDIARARWIEAAHVSRIGRASAPDWKLLQFVIEADYVFVTNNALVSPVAISRMRGQRDEEQAADHYRDPCHHLSSLGRSRKEVDALPIFRRQPAVEVVHKVNVRHPPLIVGGCPSSTGC